MNANPALEKIKDRVRKTVTEITEVNLHSGLQDDDDLFLHGMSSRASVALMLGLESEFDIEFPENMLTRETFKNIECISQSILDILGT